MYKLLNVLIKLVYYGVFLFGIWLIVGNSIVMLFRQSTVSRFRTTPKAGKSYSKNNLKLLLNTTLKRNDSSIFNFIFLSVMVFFVGLLVLGNMLGYNPFVFVMALLFGITPYLILRMKLLTNRVEGSYEGERLIIELTNQYKINDKNMIEAIDKTIPFLDDCPYSKRALFRLSLAIKESQNIDDLKYAIDGFVYSTATEWANLLGINIFLSIEDGVDVLDALNDLHEQLKEIKEVLESDRRYNNEAFVMVRILIPATYLLSVFAAVKWFGFTVEKFFEYQLGTTLGLKLGVMIYSLIIINFVLVSLLKKPKFDLGA